MAEKELKSIKFPGLEDVYKVPAGGSGGGTGADGFSPSATVEETADGAKITITDKNGTTEATVKNGTDGAPGKDGEDGAPGADGYSPSATVSAVNGGARIVIEDKNGTTTATIMNGGTGPKGDPGDDGVTPNIQIGTVTTLPAGSQATASISGTEENPLLNLGIPKGDKGDGAAGGTDLALGLTGAAAGQIAKISAVDADGKPTAWSPVDMPSGGGAENGELLLSAEAQNVASFSQDFDTKNYTKFLFVIGGTKGDAAVSLNATFYLDGAGFDICYYTKWLDAASNPSYPNGCVYEELRKMATSLCSVTYSQSAVGLDPFGITFQGSSSAVVAPKTGYLHGNATQKANGISLRFSASVSYVKVEVYGCV